ncbi:MAG: hypothetical protein QM803_02665 [Rhodocyclaceae bacterium]
MKNRIDDAPNGVDQRFDAEHGVVLLKPELDVRAANTVSGVAVRHRGQSGLQKKIEMSAQNADDMTRLVGREAIDQ